jgi:hypothetical protein
MFNMVASFTDCTKCDKTLYHPLSVVAVFDNQGNVYNY